MDTVVAHTDSRQTEFFKGYEDKMLNKGSTLHSLLAGMYWRLPRGVRKASIIRELLYLLFRNESHLKIIQIGANDGQHNDPLYDFLIESHSSALLVEPHPKHFDALCDTYKNKSNIEFINAGIGQDTRMTLYSSPLRQGIESFDVNHVKQMLSKADQDTIEETSVECISFATLLKKQPSYRSANLLLIDAEGMDAEIMSTINLEEFTSDIIIFEAKNTKCRDLLLDVENKLRASNYTVGYENGECIAIREPARSKRIQKLCGILAGANFRLPLNFA